MFCYGMMTLISGIFYVQNVMLMKSEGTVISMICEVFFGYHFIILYSLHDQFENDSSTKVLASSCQSGEFFKCEIILPSSHTQSDETMETKLDMPTVAESPTETVTNEEPNAQSCTFYIWRSYELEQGQLNYLNFPWNKTVKSSCCVQKSNLFDSLLF